MIELLQERSERPLNVGEIHQPAGLGVDLTLAHKLHLEAMAVEAPALVT